MEVLWWLCGMVFDRGIAVGVETDAKLKSSHINLFQHDIRYNWHTVGAVITRSNIILHVAVQWLRRIINQSVKLTKHTPYLALTGELLGVYC